MPGDREALAAITWMNHDQYGRPLIAGDRITYRLPGMSDASSESGFIRFVTRNYMVVEVEDDRDSGLLRAVPFDCVLPF
jgi:hypothetical protein